MSEACDIESIKLTCFALLLLCAGWVNGAEYSNGPYLAEDRWKVWGREYYFGDAGIFPTQIVSQQKKLLASPTRLVIDDSTNHAVTVRSGLLSKDGALTESYFFEKNGLGISVNKRLEDDGFLYFNLKLKPKVPTRVYQLGIDLPVRREIAKTFSRYLNYDFDKQTFDLVDSVNASGTVEKQMQLPFTPTIALGNGQVGIEWIAETNNNWILDSEQNAISIDPLDDETVELKLRFISRSDGVVVSRSLEYGFAFFVFPSKPKSKKKYHMVSGGIDTSFCESEAIQFFNWSKLPVQFPGLPVPNAGDEELFRNIVSKTQADGRKFVQYSSIYALPTTHRVIQRNSAQWSTGTNRKNPLWSKHIGVEESVMPVNIESETLVGFLVEEHLAHVREYNTDGVYFDVAIPNFNLAVWKYGKRRNESGQQLYYVPLIAHRRFLKRFWEALKAENKDFLIVHHAPKLPKFATTYIDIVIVGEELNRFFRSNSKVVYDSGRLVFDEPLAYRPDYDSLPKEIDYSYHNDTIGTQYMFLPQIYKFNNRAVLKQFPDLDRKLNISALNFYARNSLSIWLARIDIDIARDYFKNHSVQC